MLVKLYSCYNSAFFIVVIKLADLQWPSVLDSGMTVVGLLRWSAVSLWALTTHYHYHCITDKAIEQNNRICYMSYRKPEKSTLISDHW